MICVSLDLDGTLLNSRHQVSKENIQTIHALQKNNVEVIINTGRSYQDVVSIPSIKDLHCPISCVNGAMIYDRNHVLLYEAAFDMTAYKQAVAVLQECGISYIVFTNQGAFPDIPLPIMSKSEQELQAYFHQCDYDAMLTKKGINIHKILAIVPDRDIPKIKQAKQALQAEPLLAIASSFSNNLEITSVEGQKGRALKRYEQLMNQPFEAIYAFGDGENDLSQFEAATASFAMANAPSHVKEKATYVTKSNDENGVSFAVKQLLKLL